MKKLNFEGIYGNEYLKKYLSGAIKDGKLSHAYIIEGSKGTGKHTVVMHLLKALACTDESVPCNKCIFCKKISSGFCIDVHRISCEEGKKTIGVEAVRQVEGLTELVPNDLDFHAVVIEDADLMTPQAQNAFLKMLEEPDSAVYYFLITEHGDALLTTVRSRALTLRCEPLDNDTLCTALKEKFGIVCDKESDAVKLSQGSLGMAKELFENKNKDLLRQRSTAKRLVDLLFSECNTKHSFVLEFQKMFKLWQDTAPVLNDFMFAVRDMTVVKHWDGAELMFFESLEICEQYSMGITDAALNRLYETVSAVASRRDTPMSLTPLFTKLASDMYDCVHKIK